MNLKELQKHWHKFGKQDPLWAIITWPDKKGGKWKPDEFFDSGKTHVNGVMAYLNAKGICIQRKRALDFGCGVGRVTQALADHFEEVCGVDIAPSMVKLARKYNRHGDRYRHYVNDAADLKLFSSNSFDFVHTIIVLQHMLPTPWLTSRNSSECWPPAEFSCFRFPARRCLDLPAPNRKSGRRSPREPMARCKRSSNFSSG